MKRGYNILSRALLGRSFADLKPTEQQVIDQIARIRPLWASKKPAGSVTFGQRLADRVAAFGGSWTFIIISVSLLAVWVLLNSVLLALPDRFDPYPFVFLNLVLSMIAALQAPIIMMSQNRQSETDRMEAATDYQVNLKAEAEIQELHEKIDTLTEMVARLSGSEPR